MYEVDVTAVQKAEDLRHLHKQRKGKTHKLGLVTCRITVL